MRCTPGRYSSPIVMLCILAHTCLVRLKPAMATSISASAVSQFGLIRGGSYNNLVVRNAISRNSTRTCTISSLSFQKKCISERDAHYKSTEESL